MSRYRPNVAIVCTTVWLALMFFVLLMIGAGPSSARSVPYLGGGEARATIGRDLLTNFKYGAERGSLTAQCRRIARDRVGCGISFRDLDGETWFGGVRVKEYRTYYSVRTDLDCCF